MKRDKLIQIACVAFVAYLIGKKVTQTTNNTNNSNQVPVLPQSDTSAYVIPMVTNPVSRIRL